MKTRTRLDDRGQAALLVVVVVVFALMLIGLVSDGGMVLSQRRDLQGLADGAARSGASAIEHNTSPTSQVPQIDPAEAQAQISRYLVAAGFRGSVQVVPTPTQVTVDLSATYPLMFARLLGMSSAGLHATATSNPISGGGR